MFHENNKYIWLLFRFKLLSQKMVHVSRLTRSHRKFSRPCIPHVTTRFQWGKNEEVKLEDISEPSSFYGSKHTFERNWNQEGPLSLTRLLTHYSSKSGQVGSRHCSVLLGSWALSLDHTLQRNKRRHGGEDKPSSFPSCSPHSTQIQNHGEKRRDKTQKKMKL